MKRSIFKTTALLSAFMMVASTGIAGTKGRIIPDGTVTLEKNGSVAKFKDQTVVDENALIACDGTCMVKLQGISLIALDQSKFAVKESGDKLNLYVENGQVNFAISNPTQTFTFYTPDQRYVQTEGFIAPASTDKSIKGFVNTSSSAVEIGMDRGTMMLQTADGTQTINAGQSIKLAMLPEEDKLKNTKDDDDDNKGAVIPPGGGGGAAGGGDGVFSGLGTLGFAAVMTGIGLTAVALHNNTKGDGTPIQPTPPPPQPPNPQPPTPRPPSGNN